MDFAVIFISIIVGVLWWHKSTALLAEMTVEYGVYGFLAWVGFSALVFLALNDLIIS